MLDSDINQLLVCASFGWHILPIYGIVNGRCECGNDHVGSESSRGKHPRGKNWHVTATADEEKLITMFTNYPASNAGLLLGPRSGVIDVEFDDAAGRATADRIFQGCITPTYTSGRSTHRLFKWSPNLPDVQKRIVNGLEIRIGGGGKATQSVLPPSTHHSGEKYTWLRGLSPNEVEPADLPREVQVMLFNDEAPARPTIVSSARRPLLEEVVEGERDNTMLAFACRHAHRSPDIERQQEQDDLWEVMVATNAMRFKPPLDDASMSRLHRQAIKYARAERADAAVAQPIAPAAVEAVATSVNEQAAAPPAAIVGSSIPRGVAQYRAWGLAPVEGGYEPGNWRLVIIDADPVEYRLTVPAWADRVSGGAISLDAQQIGDANAVARAILSQTKSIIVNDMPRKWPALWNGTGESRGLLAQLMDVAVHEAAPSFKKAHVAAATYLAEYFEVADPANFDDDKPNEFGSPKYRVDGSLWFQWMAAWRDGLQQKLFTREDVHQLAGMLGINKQSHRRWPDRAVKGVQRRNYYVLTAAQLRLLNAIASDEVESDEPTIAPAP